MAVRKVVVDVVCEEIGPRVWQVRCGQCPPPGIIGVAAYGQEQAMAIADVHCFGHAVKRHDVMIRSDADRARWKLFRLQCERNRERNRAQ